MAVIAKEELAELVKTALLKAGVPEKSSDIIADITIQAQLRGISSHGVQMIPVYLERIKRGGLNPLAEPVVEKKSDTVWSVDGNGAFGQLAGYCAAQLIIENVKKGLPGMAGVKNSNHCGMLAYYTELIADAGAVGFMTTNTNPNVAAFGGAEKILGTNPFSAAFPAEGESIVIDMATTALAKGKLYEYARRGQPLPEGCAVDEEGYPVTDPEKALTGVLLPFAGYKGYAISLLVEMLSGVLTGAGYSRQVNSLHQAPDRQQNVGMFLAGIPAGLFMERQEYNERVSGFMEQVKNSRKAAGVEKILFPGELEAEKRRRQLAEGIVMDDEVLVVMQEAAGK
ncbi:MAG: Ldh family oxidoreductase [Dorea sp.]|nr:Ldh family oxidoreductase [Dorea sp.]